MLCSLFFSCFSIIGFFFRLALFSSHMPTFLLKSIAMEIALLIIYLSIYLFILMSRSTLLLAD